MASDLAALQDAVEADLRDATNAIWSTAQIDEAITRALRDWNRTRPQVLEISLASVAETYEYSLATLTDPQDIMDVWYPYDSTDEQSPTNRIPWRVIADGKLYITPEEAPTGDAADKIRIFYTSPHTIKDLDGETATTLDAQGEGTIILGASAYCALSYGQSLIGTVTVSGWTPRQWLEWATTRLVRYDAQIIEIKRRMIIQIDSRVVWPDDI